MKTTSLMLFVAGWFIPGRDDDGRTRFGGCVWLRLLAHDLPP
jgi:hypothetical protein